MIEKGAVLPMFYLPPAEYFAKLISYGPAVLIEKEEHFPKQTFRNRAHISSPDGLLALVVPVMKGSKNHTKVKDVKISYEFNWQRLHWQTLQACYRRSAYFEYYENELAPFYEKKPAFLFDLNEELLNFLMKAVKIKPLYQYTESYQTEYPDRDDYRAFIHPKKESKYAQKPYFQVFEDRTGFLPNLSVVDLLFSQGPHAASCL